MLSFRIDEADAADTQRWVERLGVDRSELIRKRSIDISCTWRRSSSPYGRNRHRSRMVSNRSLRSHTGDRSRIGRIRRMRRGEVWFVTTPGGDRPLVLTRDRVAEQIGSVAVAAVTRIQRGLVSELELSAPADGVPTDCVVNFDNIHTIRRDAFRCPIVMLRPARLAQAFRRLRDATDC